jgi:UDP-N-acetylglucosamine 2-epimerase (non-hydrolysing)
MKILLVFGTRPEVIKLGPLISVLQTYSNVDCKICVTAQHRHMLDQALAVFNIKPDIDLNIMQNNQSLTNVTCRAINDLEQVLKDNKPDMVLVHGDTTTTFAGALAAFYQKIAVGHVEAGLRSHHNYSPWPEEMNRRLAGVLTNLHFAPTEISAANLIKEGIDKKNIFITGNTIVDACSKIISQLQTDKKLIKKLETKFSFLNKNKKLILVTSHRRENIGNRFEQICLALLKLAKRPDIQIAYPLHLNPNIQQTAMKFLQDQPNIILINPLDYIEFSYLLYKCYLILTDSCGIQEEAPSYNKPVLILRDVTERPEVVMAGLAKLVGVNQELIINEADKLLDDTVYYNKIRHIKNPFGDGQAANRIAKILTEAA